MLHLRKNNKQLISNPLEPFIESFPEKEKGHIVQLIHNCIATVNDPHTEDDRWCYVVDSYGYHKWSENRSNHHLKVGEKTEHGSKVLYVIKRGDVLPDKYKKYLDKWNR